MHENRCSKDNGFISIIFSKKMDGSGVARTVVPKTILCVTLDVCFQFGKYAANKRRYSRLVCFFKEQTTGEE